MRQLVGTQTEGILLLAGDAVHFAEHFRGQAHHAGGLGGVQGHVRVRVNAMHHADMAHVLDTADDEHITVIGHDCLSSRVQCAHGRSTKTTDRLGSRGVRDLGQQ